MFKRGQVCYNPGEDRVVLILDLPNERGHQDVLVLDELIDPYYEDEVYRTQRWYKNEDLMPIEEALKLPQLEGISYDWKKKVPYALSRQIEDTLEEIESFKQNMSYSEAELKTYVETMTELTGLCL